MWTHSYQSDAFLDIGGGEMVRLSEIVAVTKSSLNPAVALVTFRSGDQVQTSITLAEFRERLVRAMEAQG